MKNNEMYVTKFGLRICYVEKKNFHKSYAGLGLNYGNRDLIFELDGKEHTSYEGTAHFIEHKLFQMPNGDAFQEFSKLNASANAYTDIEKTIYYFTTTSDLYSPLRLLLEMYFTPYFLKADVEKEIGIIESEIKMYDDVPESIFARKILKALYPNHSLSANIAGTVESVNAITHQDLYDAYQAFYTTDNSLLTIISHEPREKVYAFVEEVLNGLELRRGLPKQIEPVAFPPVGKNFLMKAKVEQTTAALAIRMEANQNYPLFCSFIIGILDSLFSPMSRFFKKLHQKQAFIADIDYYVVTLRDTSYAVISTTSSNPQIFLDLIEEKLKNLTKRDIQENITELYLKHLKAKSIRALDSIETLGEEILVLALENGSYLEELTISQSLSIEDFYPYISYIKHAQFVQCICKKSTKTK